MESINWILAHRDEIAATLTTIVTLASMISNLIDPKHPNKYIAKFATIVNILAINLKNPK